MVELTLPEVYEKLGDEFAIISAWRSDRRDSDNWKDLKRMKYELQSEGYKPIEIKGKYYGSEAMEPWFLVSGLPFDEAKRLARKYGQKTVMTHRGDIQLETDKVIPLEETGHEFGNAARYHESYAELPSGEPIWLALKTGEQL